MTVAQKLIGLSRSSFTPANITGLTAWYDFSDISTLWKDTGRTSAVTADADVIKGVTDKSGHGFHLSEATNGPAYKAASQNGKSIARFVGASSQKLTMAAGGWSALTQPVTLAWLVKMNSTATTQLIVDSNDANRCALFFNTTGPSWTAFAGSSQTFTGAPLADTSFHTFILVYNGASSTLNLDGTTYPVSVTPGANSSGIPLLGAASGGASFFLTGDIPEAMWVAGSMSAGVQTQLRAYVLSKWNV